MTPEQKKAYELAEKKRLEVQREIQEKADYMKKIQEQMEQDRKEKALQKAKASKANPLTFGANIVKFQPPCPPKGG